VLFRRRDRDQEQELRQVIGPGAPQLGAIVQVNWDSFLKCVNDSIRRLGLEKPVQSEYFDAVARQVTKVLSALVAPGNLVVPIWSAKAFRQDFDRKISILLELFISSAHELKGRIERVLETIASDEEKLPEKARELKQALLELFAIYDALLIAEDVVVGLIQANFRLHHMPNVVKVCLGYASQ